MPGVRRCLLVFEPPDGGVAENVMKLALGVRRHGWDPWVAGPPRSMIDGALERAGINKLPLTLERGYRRPARDLRALRELSALMRAERFALVHAHAAKAGALARLAALASSTPAVYSPHCFPFARPWDPLRTALFVLVERLLGHRTAAILCVAEAERRVALERRIAPPERLHVIHNGSDPCEVETEPDRQLERLAARGPLAATISVLRAQKAVEVFIEAVPSIIAGVPEAQLAVVGDGPLREQLVERARSLGVEEHLHFVAFEPPAARQLRSIDVFVLPSAWEAFPISILEAMACGVPQVATEVGGTSEALLDGETGYLCPPGDSEALAGRIVALLRDPDARARMGAAGRARHTELFGVERMVARTAALYDSVASVSLAHAAPPPLRGRA